MGKEGKKTCQVLMTDRSTADELPVNALITPTESKWGESRAKLKLS